MPYKYSILSFNFGKYDILREPLKIDPECEYIFVTDEDAKSKYWKVVHDKKLNNKSPWYAAFYVRYHPFEYVSTNTVIIIDASIELLNPLKNILTLFKDSEMGVTVSGYVDSDKKIKQFENSKRFVIDDDEPNKLRQMIRDFNQEKVLGSVCNALRICTNTRPVNDFNNECWELMLKYGKDGNPVRLDEIPFHCILTAKFKDIKLFYISTQILESNYISYNLHRTNSKHFTENYYEDLMFLCGKVVRPICFGSLDIYPLSYKYYTEAICLTKFMTEKDMKDWLDWHINACNFDHIHVIDNESAADIKSVCKLYGDKVSYDYISGHPRQYRLYDAYIRDRSKAMWVMPIDDDEYLEFSSEFKSVIDVIHYYERKIPHLNMLAIRWKHLFPEKFHEKRGDRFVLEYCTQENPKIASAFQPIGDNGIKTIVRRYGKIHYEETWENPHGGHIPRHTNSLFARGFNGKIIGGCAYTQTPEDITDEKIRLIHCRYKGPEEWKKKYIEYNAQCVCDDHPRPKHFKFNELLPYLE